MTRDFFRFANGASFALAAGNTFTAQNSSGSHGFDIRANVESFGNRVTCTSTNGVPLRCDAGSPPAGSELRSTNDRFTAFTPSNNRQLGTSANLSLILRNAIFDGSTAYSLGASGAACSARNCFFQRSSPPANWSARCGVR